MLEYLSQTANIIIAAIKNHEEGLAMYIKRLLLLTGLCMLIASCSTGKYVGYGMQNANETTADKGARYLLGRGVPQSNEKAFYYFNKAANEEDPFAQNEVAYMYAAGKGTPQNYAKAFSYYQRAANHGLASAQYNLGLMYWYGLGTEPNKTLARVWFDKSAAHKFEPAKQALVRYKD